MIVLFFLVPFCTGLLAFLIRKDTFRRGLLAGTALIHTGLTLFSWYRRPAYAWNGWCGLDDIGLLFLSITSFLFLAAAWYAIGYLRREGHTARKDFQSTEVFTDEPERVFTGCLLLFLGTMSLVAVSRQFGLLWIAMEATTLASAPLIYFHRHRRSLEATWKYLLICSVGIALALIGVLCLAVSATQPGQDGIAMLIDTLGGQAAPLHTQWLKAAFLFVLTGYGTKMGLAPLHTWLPDAHSEAPSVISALLSGALLNCALLGILRVYQVCATHGLDQFCRSLFVLFGIVSLAFAALFIVGQTDYKRMLAYSSVEHMGILSLGIGLGGGAVFGAMLHAVCHSCTKAALFLCAGSILTAYKSKNIADVSGIVRVLPFTALVWIAGFLAITGTPPFGTFISEFSILTSAFNQGRFYIGVLFIVLLAIIFIGMAPILIEMSMGSPRDNRAVTKYSEPVSSWLPAVLLLAPVLVFGVYIPQTFSDFLHRVACQLGGF